MFRRFGTFGLLTDCGVSKGLELRVQGFRVRQDFWIKASGDPSLNPKPLNPKP